MDGELLLLFVLIVIAFGIKATGRRGSCVIKPKPTTEKPDIEPAPQPRNKQGRTKDEQELHEWLEDNPR